MQKSCEVSAKKFNGAAHALSAKKLYVPLTIHKKMPLLAAFFYFAFFTRKSKRHMAFPSKGTSG